MAMKGASTLAALTVVSANALAGNLVLAERGRVAVYSIVVPAEASEVVRYAAEELRDFTERVTGVKLPIITDGMKPVPPSEKAIVLEVGSLTPRNGDLSGEAALNGPQGRLNAAAGGADAFRLHVEGERLRITGGGDRGVLYGVYELLERFAGCRW